MILPYTHNYRLGTEAYSCRIAEGSIILPPRASWEYAHWSNWYYARVPGTVLWLTYDTEVDSRVIGYCDVKPVSGFTFDPEDDDTIVGFMLARLRLGVDQQ